MGERVLEITPEVIADAIAMWRRDEPLGYRHLDYGALIAVLVAAERDQALAELATMTDQRDTWHVIAQSREAELAEARQALRAADTLAEQVDGAVRANLIGSRSAIADALLDYQDYRVAAVVSASPDGAREIEWAMADRERLMTQRDRLVKAVEGISIRAQEAVAEALELADEIPRPEPQGG
jgi:hypothetical protein